MGFSNNVLAPGFAGLVTGCIYGLLALGIVLIYKSNRFFNFAIAEFGTVSMLVAQSFQSGRGVFPQVPFVAASVLGVSAGVVVALLTERLVIRPLFRAPRVTLVVSTVGVALFLIQLELFLSGTNAPIFQPLSRTALVSSGIFNVSFTDLLIFATLAGAGVGAIAFFRSRYGEAILAVSMEPTAASAVGISVSRVSMLTWGIAGLLGGLAGVAFAPRVQVITPALLTVSGPLIFAFVAAVVGGMTSLPGAFAGGVVIGVVNEFSVSIGNNVEALDAIPGFSTVVIFVLLLGVLLIRPTGLLGKEV